MIRYKLNEIVANMDQFHFIFFGLKEDQKPSIENNGPVIEISDNFKTFG